jgi:hypothetical protein
VPNGVYVGEIMLDTQKKGGKVLVKKENMGGMNETV